MKHKYSLWLLGILLLGLALYWPSLEFDFLYNFDDDKLILESEANQALNSENIKAIFTEPIFGLYHPITSLSWAVEKQLYGFNSKWFHLTNILLHLLNTCLVYMLSLHFLKKQSWSLWVALLFVVHPMHTENIVWLSARKDLMYGLFFLSGLLAYIRYLKTQSKVAYLLMVLTFIASLFSKSNAVVFPAVLILFDLFENKDFKLRYVLSKIPLFVLSGLFVFITIRTQQEAGFIKSFGGEYSLLDRILMGIYSLGYYLVRLVFPLDLNPKNLYPDNSSGWLPTIYYVAPFITAGLIYLIYRLGKKNRIWWFAFAFFLIIISPVLKLIPTGNDIVSNRYAYLPYLGLYMALVYGLMQVLQKRTSILLGVWCLILAFISFQYQETYANGFSVWSKVVQKNEGNNWGKAMALNERGQIQLKLGNDQAALRDIEKALELEPKLARGLMNRALIMDKNGNPKQALVDLNKLLEEFPEEVDALKLRGVVYGKMNQIDQSISDFSAAINLAPKNTELLNNRGIAYSIKGDLKKALEDFNKAIELKPLATQFRVNRGNLFLQMDQKEEALKDYQWAFEKNSNSLNYAYPLASLQYKIGKVEEAKKVLKPFAANEVRASEIAQRLASDSLLQQSLDYYSIALGNAQIRDKTLYQRAQVYKQLGQKQNAVDDLIAILENLPNGQIFYEIGQLYFELGELKQACDYWQEGSIRKHQASREMNEKHCF